MKLNPQLVLLDKFERYFAIESKKYLMKNKTCLKCGKNFPISQLKIFRYEYIPITATRTTLKQLSQGQKQRMLIKKKEQYALNHKDIFVIRIIK